MSKARTYLFHMYNLYFIPYAPDLETTDLDHESYISHFHDSQLWVNSVEKVIAEKSKI